MAMNRESLELSVLSLISAVRTNYGSFSPHFLDTLRNLMPEINDYKFEHLSTLDAENPQLSKVSEISEQIESISLKQKQASGKREFINNELSKLLDRQAAIIKQETDLLEKRKNLEAIKFDVQRKFISDQKESFKILLDQNGGGDLPTDDFPVMDDKPEPKSRISVTMLENPKKEGKHKRTPAPLSLPVAPDDTIRTLPEDFLSPVASTTSSKRPDFSAHRRSVSFMRSKHRRETSERLLSPRMRETPLSPNAESNQGPIPWVHVASLSNKEQKGQRDSFDPKKLETIAEMLSPRAGVTLTVTNAGTEAVNGIYHYYQSGVFTHEENGAIELHHDMENHLWNFLGLDNNLSYYYAEADPESDMPPEEGWTLIDGAEGLPDVEVTASGKLVLTQDSEEIVQLQPQDISVIISDCGTENVNGTYNYTEMGIYQHQSENGVELHHDMINHIWLLLNLDDDSNYYYVPGEDGNNLPPLEGWSAFDGEEPLPTVKHVGTKFVLYEFLEFNETMTV